MPEYLSFLCSPKLRNLLPPLLLGMLLITLLFFTANRWNVVLTVDGEPEHSVEYGEEIRAENASARLYGSLFLREGHPLRVRLHSDLKPGQLGRYTVTYSAGWLWYRSVVRRQINIVDTTPPTMTLLHVKGAYTLPGQTYQEEGYQAEDNCDGDLTDKVAAVQRGDTIYYTVTDSSGNTAHAERKIIYDDPEAPVLTLRGEPSCEITAGTTFVEPGWSAWDNCDGDLTDRVEVTGAVDTYHAGAYTLRYTVSDAWGNTVSRTRQVTVQPIRQTDVSEPTGKIVYLTFDDGPSRYTEGLLDTLALYNVKASFFTVNTRYASLIAQEAAGGHSVGIHSASHDYGKIYSGEDAFWADIWTQQEIIRQMTGNTVSLLRFPGGSGNTVSRNYSAGIMTRLTQAVTEQGYRYFDWNVSAGDAGGTTTSKGVFENVTKGIEAHEVSVVLQHDTMGFSVDAVERILIWGLSRGYTFLPLDSSAPTAHQAVVN